MDNENRGPAGEVCWFVYCLVLGFVVFCGLVMLAIIASGN